MVTPFISRDVFRSLLYAWREISETKLLGSVSRRRPQHLLGILQGGLGHLRAAQHPCHFLQPLLFPKQPDRGARPALHFLLLDHEMLIGEGRNLRQMGHAQYLLHSRQGFQLLTYRLGCPSADADVNLIEDQCAGQGCPFPAAGCPFRRSTRRVVSTRSLPALAVRMIS